MRKIELILGTVAAISIAYKFILGNGINPIFILSIMGLSLFYIYFSFAYFNNIRFKKIFKRYSFKYISKWRILGTIGLGFGLGITILGILWSLMYWPFNAYYSLGVPILLIIGIISMIKFLKTKSEDYIRILKRILIIGGVGIILWLIPQETLNELLSIETTQTAEKK
ncbi:hypothetical protein G3567_02110 [Psychroflexus sp. YR1-1]|uniref:Uncharacterized protein n=1 Tax=Psychroflexus aurantiacus TaxID=2709310 RepID=A0A6B3QXX5_9FLAO|nr:hypothetical protein [Psychroflexus aurantiacus]NEV92939.1 hypothetical protein [Psychroflexus aurantiacus]